MVSYADFPFISTVLRHVVQIFSLNQRLTLNAISLSCSFVISFYVLARYIQAFHTIDVMQAAEGQVTCKRSLGHDINVVAGPIVQIHPSDKQVVLKVDHFCGVRQNVQPL